MHRSIKILEICLEEIYHRSTKSIPSIASQSEVALGFENNQSQKTVWHEPYTFACSFFDISKQKILNKLIYFILLIA